MHMCHANKLPSFLNSYFFNTLIIVNKVLFMYKVCFLSDIVLSFLHLYTRESL
jgi:hypothetical protein